MKLQLKTKSEFVNENNVKMDRVEVLRKEIKSANLTEKSSQPEFDAYSNAVAENNRLLRELSKDGIRARHSEWLLDGTVIR
jgi:hypothetical protein